MIAPAPAAVAVVQEITAGIVAHGSMLQQQPPTGSSFTAASFIGSYAVDLSGLVGIGEEDTVGQLTADGDPTNISPGKITSGTLDINNFGTLQAGQANTGTYDASIATSGRTTMSPHFNRGYAARLRAVFREPDSDSWPWHGQHGTDNCRDH